MSTLVLLAAVSSASCNRGLHTSGVAAVLPAEVSSKLSRELLAFVDALPADVEGFGYLELGSSVDQAFALGPDYQPMLDDLVEMARRRWNVDVRKLRGAGVVALQQEPLLLLDLGATAAIAIGDADVTAAKLGALTVIGKPAVVQALLASAKQQPRLVKARPAWVKDALSRAAGKVAFYSFAGDKLVPKPTASAEHRAALAQLDHATATVAGTGGAVYLTAKPGQSAQLRKPIDDGLAQARAELQQALARMSTAGADAVPTLLARHYGPALMSGIQVGSSGEVITISLPWRAPALPARTSAPALSQRMIASGEWAVLQVDLGAPMLQTLIALSDVVGAPLDRARLYVELGAELGKMMDLPAIDPRTATVSVGSASALVSLHTTTGAMPAQPFQIARGKLLAASTPWGLALTATEMGSALTDAVGKPAAGLPLAASSKVAAQGQAFFRAVVDLERLPLMASALVGELPLRTVEVAATAAGLEATVVVKPGQLPQVQQVLAMVTQMLGSQSEAAYRDRAKAPPLEEIAAIAQFHQARIMREILTPKIDGDRLLFAHRWPVASVTAASISAGVGILAAIAIPAFMDYLNKSKAAQLAH